MHMYMYICIIMLSIAIRFITVRSPSSVINRSCGYYTSPFADCQGQILYFGCT